MLHMYVLCPDRRHYPDREQSRTDRGIVPTQGVRVMAGQGYDSKKRGGAKVH